MKQNSNPDYPWKNPIVETDDYCVYKDIYAVTPGHLLFIPRERNSFKQLLACYEAAERIGGEAVAAGRCDAYNVGRNEGLAAGQTVMWPHIHLIPRRHGDMEDPRGGVRHVIPERGNYKLW
jgi:diadenosine tetraphosphate (Ap4A) HIT family hydrolase